MQQHGRRHLAVFVSQCLTEDAVGACGVEARQEGDGSVVSAVVHNFGLV